MRMAVLGCGRIGQMHAANVARHPRATLAGATVAYDNLLAALSAEGIEDLETAFKVVYRRGTPQHATVFAGGRAPYHEGAADERVDALENLRTRMEGLANPALAEVIARVTGLIEPLRALRMLHYSGWIASRWDDPAFPGAFPWFNTVRYWGEQILALREQLAILDEAPLELE